ncbi:MAG: hypothetical protein DMG67_06945 [Acidobacteria bacterium]|nr:MAG: hypothetical protein DMG67_06945 [Acidobacteriota bacterium]
MRAGNNSIETCKAMKDGDGLRIREDLPRVVEQGYESLTQEQKQLLKWVGVFFREPTPGRFMMRIRMPNGFTNSEQLRAIADVSRQLGNKVLDITTRQQIELRGFAIENVQKIWEKLRSVHLHSLQTGMDNVRNINGCPLAGLTENELLDASPVVFELDSIIVGKEITGYRSCARQSGRTRRLQHSCRRQDGFRRIYSGSGPKCFCRSL